MLDLVIPHPELITSEAQDYSILLIGYGHGHQDQTRIYTNVCLDPVRGAGGVDSRSSRFNRHPVVLGKYGSGPCQRDYDAGHGYGR